MYIFSNVVISCSNTTHLVVFLYCQQVGEEGTLTGLMETFVHVATHPDIGVPIAFIRRREQRRRSVRVKCYFDSI